MRILLLCCPYLILAAGFPQEVAKLLSFHLKKFLLAVTALSLVLSKPVFCAAEDGFGGASSDVSNQIIDRYVQATEAPKSGVSTGSVQVDINASVPKLKKNGHLRALKVISSVGRSTYRVLSFQGDPTIKKEVIARYLELDQNAQKAGAFAVVPANYKFKFKGERASNLGRDVYVFQVSPRKKRVGLFKGELWLDSQTYLPVYEAGRLVKSPSVFLKKVNFERVYAINGGVAVPEHTTSTIDARIVGRVEVSVDYSNFVPVSGVQPQNAVALPIAEASQ